VSTPFEPPSAEPSTSSSRSDARRGREGASRNAAETKAAIGRLTAVCGAARSRRYPFLVERLLSASAPFGLEVEIKSEQRVVGTWSLEVSQRAIGESYVSQAGAQRPMSAARRAAIRGPPARSSSCANGRLAAPTAGRSSSCTPASPSRRSSVSTRSSAACRTRRAARANACSTSSTGARRGVGLRLDRLQFRLLEELEGEHPIAGVDVLVAHGRGTARVPHGVVSTVPTPLATPTRVASGKRFGRVGGEHSRRRGLRARARLARKPALEPSRFGPRPGLLAATPAPRTTAPAKKKAG
jgi:hypothetical protein